MICPRSRNRFQSHDISERKKNEDYSPSTIVESWVIGKKKNVFSTEYGKNIALNQEKRRQILSELLGIEKVSVARKLDTIWIAEDEYAWYEKCHLSLMDRCFPTYFCKAKQSRSRNVWVICVQGHTTGMHTSIGVQQANEGKKLDVGGDRDIANWCTKNGLNALCIEQMSLGERSENKLRFVHEHACQDAAMQSLLFGRTLIGQRVAEVLGVAKMLKQHHGLDSTVGVLGNSLGGTVAMYSHGLSDEIDVGIMSSCVSDFQYSLLQRSGKHCIDLIVPQLLDYFECGDIVGLAAPKLSIPIYGLGDRLFPITGFRSAIKTAGQIYSEHGASGQLRPVVGIGGHRFYGELASAEIGRHPSIFGSA
jgi:hypothetical protein